MRAPVRRAGDARAAAAVLEADPALPSGVGERFSGYGVTGVTFASGHVLGLQRFAASTVGPPFTSVWHRTPAGVWTFYSDVDPAYACSRYFGGSAVRTLEDEIELTWTGPYGLSIVVRDARIAWAVHLAPTSGMRALTALAARVPRAIVSRPTVRAGFSRVAERLLGAGPIALDGRTPSGHAFSLDVRRCWTVDASAARIEERHPGPVVMPHVQPRFGDLRIPCWSLFLIGGVRFAAPVAYR